MNDFIIKSIEIEQFSGEWRITYILDLIDENNQKVGTNIISTDEFTITQTMNNLVRDLLIISDERIRGLI